MEKLLKNKRFFYILTLFFITGFLVLPNISFADEFDDINLYETGKYLELSQEDAQKLINSLKQIFTTEGIFLWGAGDVSEEKTAAGVILLNVVRVEILNHLLVGAPIEITWRIIKGAVEMSRIILDPQGVSLVLDKFEKETTKRAIAYGMDFLLKGEIRVTPGAIKFKYPSNYGSQKEVVFQYVIIYKPIDIKKGKIEIRFFMPDSIEPPDPQKFSKFLQVPNLQHNLLPFIVEINGIVEKNKYNNYQWIDENGELTHPSVNINFPSEVPDLGIKPLSLWEKYLLKPIETTIKEVEIIITKVTGKSLGLTDIWNEFKKFIDKIKSFAPAGLTESPQIEQSQASIDKTLELLTVIETTKGLVEVDPQQANEAVEDDSQQADKTEISLAELQEILDDAAEQIDILAQQIAELNRVKLEESAELSQVQEEAEEIVEETKEEEKMEELTEEEEVVEDSPQQVSEDVCWVDVNSASAEELGRIVGIGPVLAQRIIDARPFYSLSDLIRVSGIGDTTLQKIINQGCAYVIYTGGGGGGGSSYSSPSPSLPEPEESPIPPTPSTSTTVKILISEIQIQTSTSTDYDFIELYNPTTTDIDISGWQLKKRNSNGNESSIKVFLEINSIIPAQGYFLWANTEYASSTLILADATSSQTLAATNSVALLDRNDNIIDAVAWGVSISPFVEDLPFPQNPGENQTLGRKWSTTSENYIDTNNNQEDFEIQIPTPKTRNQNPVPEQPPQNQLLIAQFIFIPANPTINQEIVFDASSSTDSNGTITSYIWDFGDTSSTSSAIATTTHSYSTSSDFLVQLTVVDDNNATSSATTTINVSNVSEPETERTPTLEVVINEIAWMGTSAANSSDEWIELYNNTDSIIDLTGWTFTWSHGTTSHNVTFSTSTGPTTVIPANGFFLLERSEDNLAISDIAYDQFFTGGLNNNGEKLELRDSLSNLIDVIDCSLGWFFGTSSDYYASMERINSNASGTNVANWANNNLITRNGLDAAGNKINGTPKVENSISKSETEISPADQPPFAEFDELTLTYLGSPYIFKYYLLVPVGKTLNIEPGVVLKFDTGWIPWNAEIGGTLKAIGQEDKKIIFTSLNEPAHWGGIYFMASSINSELNWTEIKYGSILVENSSISISSSTIEHYTDRGIKLINSSSTIENVDFLGPGIRPTIIGLNIEQGSPTIKNSYFKDNEYGIYIQTTGVPQIEGNNFEDNKYPVYASPSDVILKGNRGQNNTINGIIIHGYIKSDIVWFKNEIPYIIFDFVLIEPGYSLTIEPGVTVKGYQVGTYGAYLEIKGRLTAEGAPDEPIIFTSYNDSWGGLTFSTSSQNSILRNVIVEYGGIWNPFRYVWGAVSVVESSIEFIDSVSVNSSEAGIYLENSSSIVDNSHFENNDIGMMIVGAESVPQMNNNFFSNNSKCDICWANSEGRCEEIATSSLELVVECNGCP